MGCHKLREGWEEEVPGMEKRGGGKTGEEKQRGKQEEKGRQRVLLAVSPRS